MEKYISDTINSVIQQTYPHWELIIMDDTSTDGTVELVRTLCEKDNRISLDVNTTHSGIATTRNRCIQRAKGQFLAFLDSDDIWHHEKLEKQLHFMQERKVGFSYSSYDLIDESGKPLGKTIKTAGDLDYNAYLHNTIIGCSTVMLDTNIVGKVTVPNFRTSEDAATWLDILKKGFKAYAIEESLTSYKIRRKSASSNKFKAAADLWVVYRQYEKLPLHKAIICFVCYVFNAIKKRL